jgi:endonuclease III
MSTINVPRTSFEMLAAARRVVDMAERLGFESGRGTQQRRVSDHMGSVLADAVLQAGVNYRTVVQPRVERILRTYPSAQDLDGTREIIQAGSVEDFLLWKHCEKIGRFVRVCDLLASQQVGTTRELAAWLNAKRNRDVLLGVSGVGPKTVDYLSCLVGVDAIAVDRHIKKFAVSAGVGFRDYDTLRSVFSYAADLMGSARREFDAWIWNHVRQAGMETHQLRLL